MNFILSWKSKSDRVHIFRARAKSTERQIAWRGRNFDFDIKIICVWYRPQLDMDSGPVDTMWLAVYNKTALFWILLHYTIQMLVGWFLSLSTYGTCGTLDYSRCIRAVNRRHNSTHYWSQMFFYAAASQRTKTGPTDLSSHLFRARFFLKSFSRTLLWQSAAWGETRLYESYEHLLSAHQSLRTMQERANDDEIGGGSGGEIKWIISILASNNPRQRHNFCFSPYCC